MHVPACVSAPVNMCAGSAEAWFHLMELLLPTLEGAHAAPQLAPDALAASLDSFVQASTLGQLTRRLQLLAGFRHACCTCSYRTWLWRMCCTGIEVHLSWS